MDAKQTQEIVQAIQEAEFILIGASNGLEIAEGYHLFKPNDNFMERYGDFHEKYGIQSILQGLVQQPFPDVESLWAFFVRGLYDSYHYEPTPVMKNMRQLVGDKPHFILTSNGTRKFIASGFSDDNLFEFEGSSCALQCSKGCHNELYPVGDWIDDHYEVAKDKTSVPSDMVPRCEKCGAHMMPNYEISHDFVRGEHWHKQYQKALDLFQDIKDIKYVALELGVGSRNQLIKAPFMKLVAQSPQATYITVNKGEVYIPEKIEDQSIGVDGDLAQVLSDLVEEIEAQ